MCIFRVYNTDNYAYPAQCVCQCDPKIPALTAFLAASPAFGHQCSSLFHVIRMRPMFLSLYFCNKLFLFLCHSYILVDSLKILSRRTSERNMTRPHQSTRCAQPVFRTPHCLHLSFCLVSLLCLFSLQVRKCMRSMFHMQTVQYTTFAWKGSAPWP